MVSNDILSEFSASDISHFRKDFMQVIKVASEIDRYYGEAHHALDAMLPKFEKLVEMFNKKYKGLRLKTRKTIDSFKTRVFVKESNIKDFFANAASRIPGMKSVGRSGFNQIEVGEADKFAKFLDVLLDKVCISYIDVESGTSTVVADYMPREKMVEIVYSPNDMMNESNASFRICAFYALKHGFDRKIDIHSEASAFGFMNLLSEVERREWFDRFNPRFLE